MDFERLGLAFLASLGTMLAALAIGGIIIVFYKVYNEHREATTVLVIVFLLLCTFFYRKIS